MDQVHLGVNAGGVGIAVSQVIADFLEREPAFKQVCRTGMTQGVRPMMRQRRTHGTQTPRDDQKKSGLVDRAQRSPPREEDFTSGGAWPRFLEVTKNCRTDRGGQR